MEVLTAFCHQGAFVLLQHITHLINRSILLVNLCEYFCPSWSKGVPWSPHLFPCLSQSALNQLLPALWSWRLCMSHLTQRKQNFSVCQKKHLCCSTFTRGKNQMRHLGAAHHEKAGFIGDGGLVAFIRSGKHCSGVHRRRVYRNTQTQTSVHFFWNSAAANSQDRALSSDEHGWFPWKLSPFSLKGEGKPLVGRLRQRLRVDVDAEEGGRDWAWFTSEPISLSASWEAAKRLSTTLSPWAAQSAHFPARTHTRTHSHTDYWDQIWWLHYCMRGWCPSIGVTVTETLENRVRVCVCARVCLFTQIISKQFPTKVQFNLLSAFHNYLTLFLGGKLVN